MIARLALVLSLLVAAPGAWAQDDTPVGSIMAVEGVVTLTPAGSEEPGEAAVALPVHLNDTIETGPSSRAIIVFSDESEMTLGAEALMSIDEYAYDPQNKDEGTSLASVARGAFLYVGGQIEKTARPNVKIQTAYGTIGVRGTTVWGGMLDSYGVFVLDGEVVVRTPRGFVRVGTSTGTDIDRIGGAPTSPQIWGEAKIARAVETVTLADAARAKQQVEEEKARLRALRGAADESEEDAAEEEPAEEEAPAPAEPQEPAETDPFGDPLEPAPADETPRSPL